MDMASIMATSTVLTTLTEMLLTTTSGPSWTEVHRDNDAQEQGSNYRQDNPNSWVAEDGWVKILDSAHDSAAAGVGHG